MLKAASAGKDEVGKVRGEMKKVYVSRVHVFRPVVGFSPGWECLPDGHSLKFHPWHASGRKDLADPSLT